MYAVDIVGGGPAAELFRSPHHPAPGSLLGSMPRLDRRASHFGTIQGMVPTMRKLPGGCRFAARCPFVTEPCVAAPPPMVALSPTHWSRCIRAPLERLVS